MSDASSKVSTPSEKPETAGTLIVIPTYNEKENLPRLLEAIHTHLPEAHVLIVDDNSPDGTGQIADERAASDPRIHVLHRPGKMGLGTAYIQGFQWGLARSYAFFQQMDCDFSHRPEDLPRFAEAIKDVDLVLGSRYIEGGGTQNWPLQRKIMSRGGSLYARTILGLDFRDLTGGFKCYRRKVLETIGLEKVKSSGYSFQIEMTWRTHQAGFRIQEIPILFVDREFGKSKMSRKIFLEAVTMCWKLRLGLIR